LTQIKRKCIIASRKWNNTPLGDSEANISGKKIFFISSEGFALSIKFNVRTCFQAWLITVMLFGALMPNVNVGATVLPDNENDVRKMSDELSAGMIYGRLPTSPSNPVSILSEEIAKQAQLQGEADQPLQIKLEAEPAIYTPGEPIAIKWSLVGGTADQRANLSIAAYPPDGVKPIIKNDVPESDGSLVFSPKADHGAIIWKALDYAELPLIFKFDLIVNGEVVNYLSLE
jgi:hypothetical protein